MKIRAFAAVAFTVAAFALSACSSPTAPTQPPPTYTVSGTVTGLGVPIVGLAVTVTAGPDAGKSTTTVAGGAYSLVVNGGTDTFEVKTGGFKTLDITQLIGANATINFALVP